MMNMMLRDRLLTRITKCQIGRRLFSSVQKDSWERDPRFQQHRNVGPDQDIGAQAPRKSKRFSMGPYAGGRFLVSPSEDPQSFVANLLIVGIFIYGVMQLPPVGESLPVRRRKIIKERIRQEYGLPIGWDDEIEGEDSPLTLAPSRKSLVDSARHLESEKI
jgi:hypothetical protein